MLGHMTLRHCRIYADNFAASCWDCVRWHLLKAAWKLTYKQKKNILVTFLMLHIQSLSFLCLFMCGNVYDVALHSLAFFHFCLFFLPLFFFMNSASLLTQHPLHLYFHKFTFFYMPICCYTFSTSSTSLATSSRKNVFLMRLWQIFGLFMLSHACVCVYMLSHCKHSLIHR